MRFGRVTAWQSLFVVSLASLSVSLGVFLVAVLAQFGSADADDLPAARVPAFPSTRTNGELSSAPTEEVPGLSPATERTVVPSPTSGADDDALLAAIEAALARSATGHVSVVVHRLDDGLHAEIDPGREFYAASLFKLAVLYEALLRHTTGMLSFDEPLELTAEDVVEDLGTVGFLPDGELTVGICLEAMITISDNACAVALMRTFDEARIDETLASLGLHHTSVNTRELPATAGDMARLMEALVTGEGLSPGDARYARDLLLRQQVRTGIPAGLPDGVVAGNKTGTYPGATHDVAFVESPSGTYIIAVLSDGDWAWTPIADVSAAVYATLAR